MKPYLTIIRPLNFLITALSIYVSCLLAGGTHDQVITMLFASIAGAFIGAGGMVINDIFDIEIDKINKPLRPLPSGAISTFDALMFYAALTGAGLMMSAYTTVTAVIIAFVAVPAIFLYSYKLKSTPFYGNLLVGTLTGLAFIFGGAAVGNIRRSIIPAVFALLINTGREIIKDMEDVDGDRKNNVTTFPIQFGMKKSTVLASAFLAAVPVSTIIPFIAGMYGLTYFIVVNAGVNAVILYILTSLWKDQSSKNLNLISTLLKWDMLVGLCAIYLG
ncbi:MAG: geranylgeranylglycerol-phosphate geranylgeranyltransferase [Bacteroidota bacterium]|jgi:geranylgeranylglycerol-phosphate geranylgeranyltransferase